MQYVVNLNKKTIEYTEDLPKGHLIALEKIFKPQGYSFEEIYDVNCVRIASINDTQPEQKARRSGFVYGPTAITAFEDVVKAMLESDAKRAKATTYPLRPEECFKMQSSQLTQQDFDYVTNPFNSDKS